MGIRNLHGSSHVPVMNRKKENQDILPDKRHFSSYQLQKQRNDVSIIRLNDH